MRNILISMACAVIAVVGQAQPVLTVTGSVRDSDGTPVEGIYVFISTVFEDSTFYFGSTQTDSGGVYAEALGLPEGQSEGTISISSIGCDGTYAYYDRSWSIQDPTIIQDFVWCEIGTSGDSCSVVVLEDSEELEDATVLYAINWAVEPVSYLWSNGSTSQSIVPVDTGFYCVTITGADDCTATACYYYDGLLSATVALDDLKRSGPTVSPQPASGHCTIDVPEVIVERHKLFLSAVDGRLYMTINNAFAVKSEISLDLGSIPPGYYILSLMKAKNVYSSVIVIQ